MTCKTTPYMPIVPQSAAVFPTLHDCPCTGTPMGLHFENASYSSKLVVPPATGMIEMDFSNAVDDCASGHLHVETSGCFCIHPTDIEICLPCDLGQEGAAFKDAGEFAVAMLMSNPVLASFIEAEVVGSADNKSFKIKWYSRIDGLYPHFEFIPSGYQDHDFNGVEGTATETDYSKQRCGSYKCGMPVGADGCSETMQNYTETTKDSLTFKGVVQKNLCGGCENCGPDCKCPPVRVLTQGDTPLKFDPRTAISPGAKNLVFDTMKMVYGLLTDEEKAAMPDTMVFLTNTATLLHCCKTQPQYKAIRFTA